MRTSGAESHALGSCLLCCIMCAGFFFFSAVWTLCVTLYALKVRKGLWVLSYRRRRVRLKMSLGPWPLCFAMLPTRDEQVTGLTDCQTMMLTARASQPEATT